MLTPFTKIKDTLAYRAIQLHYADRVAERSRVPLIQHIDDGLVVLDQINATLEAMQAYCLHPLFQADKDLFGTMQELNLASFPQRVLVLVMEYRYRANAWLSEWVNEHGAWGAPTAGDLEEVHHMLIADKVQNYKDFLTHHKGTHARSKELEIYFDTWLEALDVDEDEFKALCAAIDAAKGRAGQ